ncbi:microsomal glutathione S-transferase 3-like [Zingiber officinale]|uniref:Glutathione S-transferase 3, mitochondrial n=1 Tax=Zingiber officinale TaxID=94328 RepID=A0A8J5FBP5_ZINOF|nr:microsomal glutathione S-transferase 3-like [Zingiber officinale]XP_042437803.1 microsomal glutathione S-transferase 3-like [Zingiber officinale]KAG6480289.1 hypothetical protein ZIOFF_063769 [Zingiber officinale]
MAMTFELSGDYGYVVLVLAAYIFFNFWMSIQVLLARERYNVDFPTMYALESENKDAKLFNCIQRGHQNSLEMMPAFVVTLLLSGLYCPVGAAALGVVYTVGRYYYFKGYATGVPDNRLTVGRFAFMALLGLMILTTVVGVRLVLSR